MSNELCVSKKSQCIKRADSGFLSNSPPSNCDNYSMSLTDVALLTNNDHVKNLQAEFSAINNLDAAPKNTQSHNVTAEFNIKCPEHDQVPARQSSLHKVQRYFKQDDDGDTQLHISVYNQETKAALLLIANASKPCWLDIRNDDCLTALHYAVMSKQHEIVRKLVLAGANTKIATLSVYNQWTCHGNAALHMACEANDLESVRCLTEPLNDDDLQWLARHRKIPPVLGQDLEQKNCNGATPMHLAIKKGHLEIVKQLVQVGAQVNTDDPCSGFTTFHYAITHKHRHIVEYMATHHPSCINVPTRFGIYAYEIALNVDKQLAEDLVGWGAQRIVHESDSESYTDSESDESSCDDSEDYSSSLVSCSNVYQGPVATATLIIT